MRLSRKNRSLLVKIAKQPHGILGFARTPSGIPRLIELGLVESQTKGQVLFKMHSDEYVEGHFGSKPNAVQITPTGKTEVE